MPQQTISPEQRELEEILAFADRVTPFDETKPEPTADYVAFCPSEESKKSRPAKAEKPKRPLWLDILCGVGIGIGGVVLLIVLFFLTIFYTPFFPEERDQYILMTSQTSNPWLCTLFFSQETIDDVIKRNSVVSPEGETDTELVDVEEEPQQEEPEPYVFATSEKYAGEVLYDDGEVQVQQFSGKTVKGSYTAHLVQVRDPSRVFLGVTNQLGDGEHPSSKPGNGQYILSMLETNNALCGINAGGFLDLGGHGSGGIPTGIVVKDSVVTVYEQQKTYDMIAFDQNNVLVLGTYTADEVRQHNFRDGIDWGPFLILNGEKASLNGLSGGYDPRSAIGQRADGAVLLLQVDGSAKRSIDGANMALLMDIMSEFGAVNAANLDGGTSSITALNGQIISTVCNPTIVRIGRRLSTAWLVANEKVD